VVADAESLFAEYRDRVFRYMCRASGRADTARDWTQDVFLHVSRTRVPAAPDRQLAGWLFAIARNVALDKARHQRRQPEESRPSTVMGRAPSQETAAAVNEALAALPDLDRDVFLMREVAGLGYDEIATACELTSGAVRSRIHRARLQLRDHLSGLVAARQTGPMRQWRT
jgi:RNA polymerase sigma-70 factor, ECF subfamily